MTMLDATTAIVYNHADLSDALIADDVDYIYLGDNITMTAGIRINPAKTSLVIDGLYEPISTEIRVLTDHDINGGQIYMNSVQATGFDLTFQNLTIFGRNYYGMPYIHDVMNAEYVTVTYINVTYTGPQMIWHTRGLARWIDCDVSLVQNGYSPIHEVGEINRVEIGGHTTMYKPNNSDAVFWFYGMASRRPYFRILADADVNITTGHYFIYEHYPLEIVIEQDANFNLNTNSGISYNSGHTIASFTVEENAVFTFTQTMNRLNYATMYIDGELRVGEGAAFYMQADFANSGALIRFTGSSCGIYLDNPKSFVLYNGPSSSATAIYSASLIPFEFTGNQVNFWTNPTAFPTAGTLDDIPYRKWNRPEWGIFTMSGTTNNSQTNTVSDFTEEELEDLPPLSEFHIYDAKVISVGNLPLEVDPVIIGENAITGHSEGMARIRVVYIPGGDSPEGDADYTGFFSLEQPEPTPLVDWITVYSNTPFLIVSLLVATAEEGELYLKSVPELIKFAIRPMTGFAGIVLPRQDPDVAVVVADERVPTKTEWTLWARILGPLQNADGDILEDAIVFSFGGGNLVTLTSDPIPVYTAGPFPDVTDVEVTWENELGLLARITGPIRSDTEYTAQMRWDVLPTGEIPPDEDDSR